MSEKATQVDTDFMDEGNTFEFLVGYRDSEGKDHKDFDLIEMTGEDEENISRPEVQVNAGKVVTTILARCITRIGTISKSDMKPKAWEEVIRSLFAGDRDYAMLQLRKVTKQSSEIAMKPRCPSCRSEFSYLVDMDEDLEIKGMAEEIDPFSIPFSLKRGVTVQKTGKVYKDGLLRLPNGSDQEALSPVASRNLGQANTVLITRVVQELGSAPLSSLTFRNMTSADRETILTTVSEHSFGPRLQTTIFCPSCGHGFEANLGLADFL